MSVAFLALFGIGEFAYVKFRIAAEHTRKFIHVSCGVLSMLLPVLFDSVWPVLFLTVSFTLLLLVSVRTGLLRSINAVPRATYGSLVYPFGLFLSFLFFILFDCGVGVHQHTSFYLPVLVLAFADPAAAFCGQRLETGKFKTGSETKTLAGSLAFFLVAFVVSFLVLNGVDTCIQRESRVACALVIALFSATAEAFSRKGLDNLFIPCVVIAVYFLFIRLQGKF